MLHCQSVLNNVATIILHSVFFSFRGNWVPGSNNDDDDDDDDDDNNNSSSSRNAFI